LNTLQTIVINQEAEKEEMRSQNSNGRTGPVADGILPLPRNNIMLEGSNSWDGHRGSHTTPLPRMEFTTFQGENPRSWIRICRKYFKLYLIPVNQWVEITSMYLEGRVEVWFEGLMASNGEMVSWEEFTKGIYLRFGAKKDVVKEFNKLSQENEVKGYIERFEGLGSLMQAFEEAK
jgi:hypothetical protein